MSIEFNGKIYVTDTDGFLQNPDEWSVELATKMAADDDCDLGPDHWEAINFLRDYYANYAIAPACAYPRAQHGETFRQG